MPNKGDLIVDARTIAEMVGLNIEDIKSPTQIDMAIDKMVVSVVVARYTLIDDLLEPVLN